MSLNDVFGNRQTQASTSAFTRASSIHSIEAFENARLLGLWDSDTRVGNGHDYVSILGAGADYDFPPGRSVLNRVIEQVLQHFRHSIAVSESGRNPFGAFDLQGQLILSRAKTGGFYASGDESAYRYGPELEFHLVRLNLRELEQIICQAGQPPRMVQDDFQEMLAIANVLNGPAQKRFREPLDRCQRRFEFV
jgi:hypothetical protein